MLRMLSCAALALGLMILAFIILDLVNLARLMAPFGGIPWSVDLLRLNVGRLVAAAVGLALLILSACGFARTRRRDR